MSSVAINVPNPAAQASSESPSTAAGVFVRPLAEHRLQAARPRLSLVSERPQDPEPAAPSLQDVRKLLTGILEVLDGRRPRGQLARLVPCRYERALVQEISLGPRTLRSMHLSRTGPGVVDLCARIERRGRSRALAGRLELRDDRWEFTVLALV